jgi:RimJ/RimL family protein N-acetyltransferase
VTVRANTLELASLEERLTVREIEELEEVQVRQLPVWRLRQEESRRLDRLLFVEDESHVSFTPGRRPLPVEASLLSQKLGACQGAPGSLYDERVQQLEPVHYEAVRPLIPSAEEAGHTAFAHAVLDRMLPGRVFADQASNPAAAVICPDNGFLMGVGQPDRALADDALSVLMGDFLERHAESRLVVAPTDGWDQVLNGLLPVRSLRLEYRYVGPAPAPALPDGYALEPFSTKAARLFGRGVDPWVIRTLGGPDSAAARTFGAVVMAPDGSLGAACIASAIGGGEAEIEIGTDPRHRKRGLATAAGVAFIDACRERGVGPAWTCDLLNLASRATASRLGFELVRQVAVYPVEPRYVRTPFGWQHGAMLT